MGCGQIIAATRRSEELGEDFGWGDGEFGDEVLGDVGCREAQAGGLGAAEVPSVEVEAASEQEEYLLEVALDGADDVFAEEGLSSAVFAEHAADGLGLVEESADFVDEGTVAAEVDGALAAVFAPSEAEVGSEAAAAVGAPGGGDGALGGEAERVFAEEGEGRVVFGGSVHGQGGVRVRGSEVTKKAHRGTGVVPGWALFSTRVFWGRGLIGYRGQG